MHSTIVLYVDANQYIYKLFSNSFYDNISNRLTIKNINAIEIDILEKNFDKSLDKNDIKRVRKFVQIIYRSKESTKIMQLTKYNSLKSKIANNKHIFLKSINITTNFESKM